MGQWWSGVGFEVGCGHGMKLAHDQREVRSWGNSKREKVLRFQRRSKNWPNKSDKRAKL